MSELMKPAEYAKRFGISRQAVYAKIKKGTLLSKDVDGQIYIVSEEENALENTTSMPKERTASKSIKELTFDPKEHYEALFEAKNETIETLKKRIEDLKESNLQLTETLQGEIALLKEAFYEVKQLYIIKNTNTHSQKILDVTPQQDITKLDENWVGFKKFCKHINAPAKLHKEIKRELRLAYKSGDKRVKIVDGKLKINISSENGVIFS